MDHNTTIIFSFKASTSHGNNTPHHTYIHTHPQIYIHISDTSTPEKDERQCHLSVKRGKLDGL